MTTFVELGIPFPLFEGPTEGTWYAGIATCSLCARPGQHAFVLGIGCALMLACPSCQTVNGLDAVERAEVLCRRCGGSIPFPDIADVEIRCCYACLRAGRGALAKHTELGMVSWEEAFEGVTQGAPGLSHPDFEMVAKGEGWAGARLPREVMAELLRTPSYPTRQGERWLFCCKRPMVYVGTWGRGEFARNAPDGDGRALFARIVPECWPGMWEDHCGDRTSHYVFKCRRCGGLRSHWDGA